MNKVKELLELKAEAVEFFNGLIELTGTYFLSDYVEDVKEYLGESSGEAIVKQRDDLKKRLDIVGLSLHNISQEVAEKSLEEDGIDSRRGDFKGNTFKMD